MYFFFFWLTIAGEGLRLSRVTVPQYKIAGESAVLKCPYELERNQRDRIYAIKVNTISSCVILHLFWTILYKYTVVM